MAFKDLSEKEQIDTVKDRFIKNLEMLAKDTSKIREILGMPANPDKLSDTDKADYEKKMAQFKKIEEIVSKTQRTEGCLCGTCYQLSFSGMVPDELLPVIELSRKQCEEGT